MDDYKKKEKLEEFMNLYSKKIFNFLNYAIGNKEEAKDLVQDVFFKVYKSLPKFRGDSSPYTWIYKIAINTLRNYIKKKKAKKFFSLEKIPEEIGMGYDPPSRPPSILYDAFKEMPQDLKEVILLYYYEEYGTREISEILDIPEGTVKSRLYRAREFIKNYFEKRGTYGV